jgi:DNA-binding YbaB/EbfC family protein
MNIQKMMQEAQKLQSQLQEKMAAAQEQLAEEHVEGSAGGGLVTVALNGHKELISVSIKPEAVDPEDVETLEDLVFAAFQGALSAAEARSAEVMSEVQGGLGLPAGMDLGGILG